MPSREDFARQCIARSCGCCGKSEVGAGSVVKTKPKPGGVFSVVVAYRYVRTNDFVFVEEGKLQRG